MARFDVHETKDGTQLLLDCQADTLDYFNTRFVVPLVEAGTVREASRLHPTLTVNGKKWIMATQLASAVSIHELGTTTTNLNSEHHLIMGALDMLISGY
jgi:toxin CcdB